MIIPSIDIMDGKAVQLRQGKEKLLERDDTLELAREFSQYGEIAVVDLDAALGKGENTELIKKICRIAECRVGGGIRTAEKAEEMLRAGAKKIVVGTMATPEFLEKLPKDRIIVAVDTKEGFVMNNGWRSKTSLKPAELALELESYCSEFLFTNIDKEGMMVGVDFEIIDRLSSATKNKLTVAGGITTADDIRELEARGVNSQIGMALYTGKIELDKAFISLLDFDKNKGLIPTVVQDRNKNILMLAYSTRESLQETFRTGNATYYSRSRKKLWTKGESSGNYQRFIRVKYDCDRDTILFTVQQKKAACHTGEYSCFGEKDFGLEELYTVIKDRMNNPVPSSYTSKISESERLIKEKIKEECEEVLDYKDKENLVWEIADLTYFVMVLMAKKGITLEDIKNELWRRR